MLADFGKLVFAGIAAWVWWSVMTVDAAKDAEKEMQRINQQVVTDAVEQFNIASKHGNATDVCVHAGLVKAALMQAKMAKEFAEWNEIEKNACDR